MIHKALRKSFSTFGLPSILVWANPATDYMVHFSNLLETRGTSYKTCTPFHPASNRQVERYFQTVKM